MSSNSLFPSKLASLLLLVLEDKGLMSRCSNENIKPPLPDKYHRIMLCSSPLQNAVGNKIGEDNFRIRLAIPKEYDYPLDMALSTIIEVYSVKGDLLCDANVLRHIDRELSLAIELELVYALLETKGIKVDQV